MRSLSFKLLSTRYLLKSLSPFEQQILVSHAHNWKKKVQAYNHLLSKVLPRMPAPRHRWKNGPLPLCSSAWEWPKQRRPWFQESATCNSPWSTVSNNPKKKTQDLPLSFFLSTSTKRERNLKHAYMHTNKHASVLSARPLASCSPLQ